MWSKLCSAFHLKFIDGVLMHHEQIAIVVMVTVVST